MTTNRALVFVKPHANNEKAVSYIENFLSKKGVTVVQKSTYSKQELEPIIDRHYTLLSSGAIIPPKEVSLPWQSKLRFLSAFKVKWESCVKSGYVFSSSSLIAQRKVGAEQLLELWDDPKSKKVSLLEGLTVAKINLRGKDVFVLNGFYPALRAKFVGDNSSVTTLVVEFQNSLGWKRFRREVIGASNPEKAFSTSIRKSLLDNWKQLGMESRPNMSENGVHASAGAVESLRERMLWSNGRLELEDDELALSLLDSGLQEVEIEEMIEDRELFETTKEMNTDDCLILLRKLHRLV